MKMAASVARRCSFLQTLWRTSNSANISHSVSPRPIRSNFMFLQTRISHPRSPSRLRRESLFLNSLLPLHSAIASACLVSKLPNEASTSTEGSSGLGHVIQCSSGATQKAVFHLIFVAAPIEHVYGISTALPVLKVHWENLSRDFRVELLRQICQLSQSHLVVSGSRCKHWSFPFTIEEANNKETRFWESKSSRQKAQEIQTFSNMVLPRRFAL